MMVKREEIDNLKLQHVFSTEFETVEESVILAPPPENDNLSIPKAPADLPDYFRRLYDIPLFNSTQHRHVFRQFNYLKWKASELRGKRNICFFRKIKSLYEKSQELRDELVQRNMRLVVSFSRGFTGRGVDFFDFISEGNLALFRAIDRFDYMKGFQFSTYAGWAIKHACMSLLGRHAKYSDRCVRLREDHRRTRAFYMCDSETWHSLRQQERVEKVNEIIEVLDDPREFQIICARFGLNGEAQQTLTEVGGVFGISKERVRQLQARALRKMRRKCGIEP